MFDTVRMTEAVVIIHVMILKVFIIRLNGL